MTKHEQIVSYIESLNIGQKISVRKIAKVMNVSEGTAYRAIKDASQLGFVTTIDRVGTVRIDKKSREQIEHLTFQEIVNIIEGDIISGKSGLNKTVSKFAIGAMELKDVVKYIGNQTLLIVGNRPEVQMEALKRGSGILITGGFSTTQNIIDYANKQELPIISSNYDTFLVANIINRAMYNQMIRKEILIVEDIVKPINDMTVVFDEMGLDDYISRAKVTGHSRFPVVNKDWKLVGIVTSKEVIHMNEDDRINKVMTRRPINVELTTTVASCAHIMIWEGIEILPVTTRNKKAICVAIIEETIKHELRKYKKVDVMIESLNIIYIKNVAIESTLDVKYNMLDVGRNFAKLEVTMTCKNEKVANAMIICQMFEDI